MICVIFYSFKEGITQTISSLMLIKYSLQLLLILTQNYVRGSFVLLPDYQTKRVSQHNLMKYISKSRKTVTAYFWPCNTLGSTAFHVPGISEHNTLIQCWFNVDPASATLAQH